MIKSHSRLTQHHNFHSNGKETLVLVDKKLFKLVPHEDYPTMEALTAKWPKDQQMPYVRFLNPIPERTPQEQASKDREIEDIRKALGNHREEKVTSVKKAIQMGADVPAEVARLLELKKKTKDEGERRAIRKQLRKLDYKRYITEA